MGNSVNIKCTLNRRYLPVDKRSIVYLAIEVLPPGVKGESENLSSAICILIDRSGSMRGRKIEQAKIAARRLLNQLQPDDFIGLVTFSSAVEEVAALDRVQEMDILELGRRIDKIKCGGGTELYRALDAVYQQFLRSGAASPEVVKRVILLSDGQPTDHIPEGLYIRLAKEMGEAGISVIALGLGKDYNEDIMSELAEHSRGIWKHISTADDIPAIFSQELDETRVVIRVKPELLMQLGEGVEMKMVYKFMPEALKVSDMKRSGADVIIPISDIRVMEPQTFVAQLSASPAPEGERCLVRVQIVDQPASQQEVMVTHTTDDNLWGTESDAFPRGIFLTAETQVIARQGLSGDETALSRAKHMTETILADPSLSIDAIHETTTMVSETIKRAERGLTSEETKVAKQNVTRVRRRSGR